MPSASSGPVGSPAKDAYALVRESAQRVKQSEKTVVRTNACEIVLANRTASIVSWTLRHYPSRSANGRLKDEPLDLVPLYSDEYLGLKFGDAPLEWRLAGATPRTVALDEPDDSASVAFVTEAGPIEITKTFRFHGAPPGRPKQPYGDAWRAYAVDVELSFRNVSDARTDALASGYALRWGPGITADHEVFEPHTYGVRGGLAKKAAVPIVRAVADANPDEPELQTKDPDGDSPDKNTTLWAAIHSKYFVAAMIPADVGSDRTVLFSEYRAFPKETQEPARLHTLMEVGKEWLNDKDHFGQRKTQHVLIIPTGTASISDRIASTLTRPAGNDKERAKTESAQRRIYAEFGYVTSLFEGAQLTASGFFLDPGATHTDRFRVYAGPKHTGLLKAALTPDDQTPARLDLLVNFGNLLGALGNGLLWTLKAFDAVVHNYGVAIIILTFLVRLAMYPISQRSSESMKRMQTRMKIIQPELEAVRQKYRDDAQRMNAETMKVYRKYGVNPAGQLGGCLMLLLQMPIFIAMYRMLGTAAELRGEPFMLWMDDLTAPDSLLVVSGFSIRALPLLMTAGTILQQRMSSTGSAMEGAQKTMMYMMPVMLLFIFYGMPSGLNLYWGVSTFLGVGQQLLVNKYGKKTGEENLTLADLEREAKQEKKKKRARRALPLR
jgi:YidC/Oxa1 family membrane protein insertase